MVAPLPPQLTGVPPAGFSPASQPSGNPGATANAVAQIREAIKILEKNLAAFEIGDPLQKAVAKAVSSLSEKFPESEASPGVQATAQQGLQSQQQQKAPWEAIMQQQQGGGGQMPPQMPGM